MSLEATTGSVAPTDTGSSSPQGAQNGSSPSVAPSSGASQGARSSGDASSQAQQAQTQQAQQAFMRELKANGKTYKITSQEEYDDLASKGLSSYQRWTEAKNLTKDFSEKDKKWTESPLEALKAYGEKKGWSREKLREEVENYYSEEFIKMDEMSEEEKAFRQREQQLKAREEAIARRDQEERERLEAEGTDKELGNVFKEITSALEASNLPQKNKFLVSRMAFYMHKNAENGYNATTDQIMRQVAKEHKGLVNDYLNSATVDQIVDAGGQEFIDKVLKYSLEKVRAKKNPQSFTPKDQSGILDDSNEIIDSNEVNRRLKSLMGGRFTTPRA